MLDLAIVNGKAVLPEGIISAGIGVKDGKIATITSDENLLKADRVVNAEGKYIIHKDREMETAYRVVEWHWQEFDGPYDRVDQSRLVDVPYKRYPRTLVPPYSVEISVLKTITDDFVLVSPFIEYSDPNKELLKHVLNLFLETFGQITFF